MIIIGIDPGQSGGLASLWNGADGTPRTRTAVKMPDTESELRDLLREWRNQGTFSHAYIERVHSMPKQGVASSFKFGQNYGLLRGILIALEIPFEEVTPQKWQKAMGCLTKGDKNVSKARAQQLFPQVGKITHATADALLICEYGRRVQAGIV